MNATETRAPATGPPSHFPAEKLIVILPFPAPHPGKAPLSQLPDPTFQGLVNSAIVNIFGPIERADRLRFWGNYVRATERGIPSSTALLLGASHFWDIPDQTLQKQYLSAFVDTIVAHHTSLPDQQKLEKE